jgi:hypothetical protein
MDKICGEKGVAAVFIVKEGGCDTTELGIHKWHKISQGLWAAATELVEKTCYLSVCWVVHPKGAVLLNCTGIGVENQQNSPQFVTNETPFL